MNVYEMEGFLRGKCLPGNLLVGESHAEYLVRKLNEATAVKAERDALAERVERLSGMFNESIHATKLAEQRADALLAENVAMREAIEFSTAADMWIEQHDGMLDYRYSEWYVDILNAAIETPATNAALTAVEARGVEKAVERITILMNHQAPAVAHVINALNILAVELREAK